MTTRLTRRGFHKAAVAAGVSALAMPAIVRGRNLNSKLNIAMLGSGGRGRANAAGVKSENITVLCDVDAVANGKTAEQFPGAKLYSDFRKVFDNLAAFDAVVVSTCEHTHAVATMMALKNKKHVYCEKPLTHNVWEARQIREAAAGAGVATQMGVQMHATENMRQAVELVRSDVIGPIREAHVWVSRAWGLQSKEASDRNQDRVYVTERPTGTESPPSSLAWDLWLGPAPARPFDPVYVPGPKWYRWWDFGNGTMSDLGSHWNDLAFWALKLQAPTSVEAFGPPPHPEIAPASMRAVYEYPARGDLPPVTLTWYQGEPKPPQWLEGKIEKTTNGVLFVGAKGMIHFDQKGVRLLPEKEFAGFKRPAPSIPRTPSHYAEWIAACKGGPAALADFQYSGWMTEANHLGNVAYRAGKKLQWDAAAMRATNAPEADQYVRREYRKGWTLG